MTAGLSTAILSSVLLHIAISTLKHHYPPALALTISDSLRMFFRECLPGGPARLRRQKRRSRQGPRPDSPSARLFHRPSRAAAREYSYRHMLLPVAPTVSAAAVGLSPDVAGTPFRGRLT
ncbi:hypothetical protein SBA4_2780014 [Candidatus Sulfopaludibacter sp. SbA4]|nr:hypothetical protein SBA4_2780014 [Candidatus Sulfopaludibacter sp. SbA4]